MTLKFVSEHGFVVVPFQNGHESACATCMKLCNTSSSCSCESCFHTTVTCNVHSTVHILRLDFTRIDILFSPTSLLWWDCGDTQLQIFWGTYEER